MDGISNNIIEEGIVSEDQPDHQEDLDESIESIHIDIDSLVSTPIEELTASDFSFILEQQFYDLADLNEVVYYGPYGISSFNSRIRGYLILSSWIFENQLIVSMDSNTSLVEIDGESYRFPQIVYISSDILYQNPSLLNHTVGAIPEETLQSWGAPTGDFYYKLSRHRQMTYLLDDIMVVFLYRVRANPIGELEAVLILKKENVMIDQGGKTTVHDIYLSSNFIEFRDELLTDLPTISTSHWSEWSASDISLIFSTSYQEIFSDFDGSLLDYNYINMSFGEYPYEEGHVTYSLCASAFIELQNYCIVPINQYISYHSRSGYIGARVPFDENALSEHADENPNMLIRPIDEELTEEWLKNRYGPPTNIFYSKCELEGDLSYLRYIYDFGDYYYIFHFTNNDTIYLTIHEENETTIDATGRARFINSDYEP